MNFDILRKRMVEEQLMPRGINDQKVLQAFYKVERHLFMPRELRETSYADYPVPIGEGQTISQPFIVALMTECLGLSGEEKVLEIGTGSGYQTAILAELAKEVYSVERFAKLSKNAESALRETGYQNVKLKVGDGSLGWPEEAPFDRIIITAASPRIPLPLTEQLKDGGRLVLPLGESFSQMLTVVEKKGNKLESTEVCGCVFVPLVGKYGWRKEKDA
jgi:protein-L-isoaspartate(D-aspartate) O-methyltransferase